MKRSGLIVGLTLLAVLAALPVLAQGMGWGMSGRGHGFYGGGPAWVEPRTPGNSEAGQGYYRESQELDRQLQVREQELRRLMADPSSTKEDLVAKQQEVDRLRARLDSGQRSSQGYGYPDSGYGQGYGSGQGWSGGSGTCGGGYGRGMGRGRF